MKLTDPAQPRSTLACGVTVLILIAAVAGGLAAALLCLFVFPRAAHADPVRGSYAYDYRNVPTVAGLLDREMVVLSARGMLAPGRVDSLRAAGVRAFVLVQPNQAFSGGVAVGSRPGDAAQYPWDTATYGLALEHGALLRDSSGALVDMFVGTPWSSIVLDFRNRAFALEYAAVLVKSFPLAAGVVLDYGCPWIPVAVPDWPAWRAGWVAYLEELHRLRPDLVLVAQCDQWARDLPVDGVRLERVGSELNPPGKSFDTALALAGAGKRIHMRQEWTHARTRRFFSSTAVMFDGAFDLCGDPNRVPPVHTRDVEHYAIAAGLPVGAAWERAPGVWQRMLSRGLVIVNVSGAPLVYEYNRTTSFSIAPGDALLLQNRDARGRFMRAVTNANR